MRNSMAVLTPQFSANRTVREYTEKYYLPAAENYLKRSAEKGSAGIKIMKAQHELNDKWNGIKVEEVKTGSIDNGYSFETNIFLNGIDQNKIIVELFANGIKSDDPERIKMNIKSSANGAHLYNATAITTRPASDYTIRVIPSYENISVPLENNLILWQH